MRVASTPFARPARTLVDFVRKRDDWDMTTTSAIPVLIVDDQPAFRRAACAVVDCLDGFAVAAEATSGEEAVDLAQTIAGPMLVLMDINLGGMNGIAATRLITDADPSAVVFLLSTYAAGDLPSGAAACGARAYIHKEELDPYLLEQLWEEELAGAGGWRTA